ncbi:MAG: hypothetical protein R3C97_01545 [Geminicoccaceae bacterium]
MGGMSNLATIGMNMALTQEAWRKEDRKTRKATDRQLTEIDEKTAQAERKKRDALAARIASARARAGAAGTGTTGGAVDALVRGLEQETDEDIRGLRDQRKRSVQELLQKSGSGSRRSLLDLTAAIPGLTPKRSSGYRSLLD